MVTCGGGEEPLYSWGSLGTYVILPSHRSVEKEVLIYTDIAAVCSVRRLLELIYFWKQSIIQKHNKNYKKFKHKELGKEDACSHRQQLRVPSLLEFLYGERKEEPAGAL